jgi:glutamate carboxypeptidase
VLHVGDETGDEDEVERAITESLISDGDIAAPRIPGFGQHPSSLRCLALSRQGRMERPTYTRRMTSVAKLAEIVDRRRDEFLDSLREMVNIDCGSFSPGGVNRIADLCELRFNAGGWEIERRSHLPAEGEEQLGDLLIGRLSGLGGPNVMLLGHMDTVFSEGTARERPFHTEGDRAFGPGVSDMKSGLLAGIFAVEALQEVGEEGFGSITYVCNPDEEIGSPFSGTVIRQLAADVEVAYVLEAARENGELVSARKGVSDARIDITGRAAHAGAYPERGRSAVLEAANKIVALHALNRRWPGVTVNVGVVSGGTRPNVVAAECYLEIDIRAEDESSLAQAEAEVRRIAEDHTVPDIDVRLRSRSWHRPMQKTPASTRLVDLAREIAAELRFPLQDTASGGASDGNTTAAAGVPTLDGLGPIGGDWHGPEEWLDLASVTPRVALLAAMIARAGEALTGS